MLLRRFLACFVVLALLGATPLAQSRALRKSLPIAFSAPAGTRPAGALAGPSFSSILPSGRIVNPAGSSVVVGMNALGVALTPDGRFAVVSNDDERQSQTTSALDPATSGGYSLAVVDVATMRVVDRYTAPKETFFAGLVAMLDPAKPNSTLVLAAGGPSNKVYALDLDEAGHLTPDSSHTIAMPLPSDARLANAGHAFPSTIVASPGATRAYVVNNLAGNVVAIDPRTRSVVGEATDVGFFPFGAALAGSSLLVTNEGLMSYGKLASPAIAPRFGQPPGDSRRASSLSVLELGPNGELPAANPARDVALPMDRAPDGLRIVGGAHPTAVIASPDGAYAYVAMTNVDRISTVALAPSPHVVGGTELRLFDKAPYGTQPDALAISRDGKRLYAALAGLNAVAVIDARDPAHLHRLGLIPTGWYPTALALAPDGRTLFVANAKGFGHDAGFRGAHPFATSASGRTLLVEADSNAVWSTLQRIDLRAVDLAGSTKRALSYARASAPAAADAVVPAMFAPRRRSPIKHVVLILEENKTYDSMLGDLTDAAGRPHGNGDPSLVSFDETVTPNLHALARRYGLAANFYADAEESDAGHQFTAGGIATAYSEKTLLVKTGRYPLVNKNEDPEDYPRAGYIFHNLARNGMSYRDYGDLVRLSGYDEGRADDPKTDDPNFVDMADEAAATRGLGGTYSLDVPAPGVLAGHVDLNYPGWNLRIRDMRRAREFIRDFERYAKAGHMPQFTYIWLPADHTGFGKDVPPIPEEVADGDRALGAIVQYLSHLPTWGSTAIFIMPDDAQSSRDHVNEHRSYALVVSPYAKRHYVGGKHLSTVSVLKTEEEILGLPPLSLGDLLATDMRDFFTSKRDLAPYSALPVPVQHSSAEGARIARLLERTDQSRPDADSVRGGKIAEYSRRADALAADRGLSADAYSRAQRRLYDAAERLVR